MSKLRIFSVAIDIEYIELKPGANESGIVKLFPKKPASFQKA
jgi:hypothetical protein